MANYQTHVSVGAAAGLLAVGVSSLWLHDLGADILLMGIFFGFLGGMIPDIDHDRGHAVAEIGALLSTMTPVVTLAVWTHSRGHWVTWSLVVVVPCHYLLHWLLPQMAWWGRARRHSVKEALQSTLVAALCVVPSLFIFPRQPYGYLKTWLLLVGLALAIQIVIPIFKLFTVHRGTLHSIPFTLIFAEALYLFLQPFPWKERLLLALAGWVGALSHLILDEIYSVDFDGQVIRLKRSFGTAFKFWYSRYPAASGLAYAVMLGLGFLCFLH